MKSFIRSIIAPLLPKFVKDRLLSGYANYCEWKLWQKHRKLIYDYYNNDDSRDIKEIIKFLHKTSGPFTFPYSYVEQYNRLKIDVFRDIDNYPYVSHESKKMFGVREWSDEEMRQYYLSLLVEQDLKSPHCYFLNDDRKIRENDVIADIGAAEGIFTLGAIDKIKFSYIFECDEKWIEPLRRTFAPYKEKIEIVEKFVGDKTMEHNVRLDDFFAGRKIDYIKADIEGAERLMLMGAETTLTRVRKVLVCVYHRPDDYEVCSQILESHGFKLSVNPGYMFWICSIEPPYLRHGVLFGSK